VSPAQVTRERRQRPETHIDPLCSGTAVLQPSDESSLAVMTADSAKVAL
jgi:hypothetical protein